MPAISTLAPAKINLSLRMVGKREDGYHLLESLVVFADIGDKISVEPAKELSLEISGEFAQELTEENIILKAARALQAKTQHKDGAKIKLEKNLPVGAGLGGGSSDAATTLKLLAKLWDIETDIFQLALPLGADIPVCLYGKTCQMSGIGEIISPAEFPPMAILLVNPKINLSTAEVFKNFALKPSPSGRGLGEGTMSNKERILTPYNDLQPTAIKLCPSIAEILTALNEHSNIAQMSGSGATCFALFDQYAQAQKAAQKLQTNHPDWWISLANIL